MIQLQHIKKTYQMGAVQVQALSDVSLSIGRGEFVAIMGASGSGKSTLLHILGLLDKPDSGSYSIGGEEVSVFKDRELAVLRNTLAGFVFQQFHLLSRVTALENVELPLVYAGKRKLKEKALKRLEEVGLGPRMKHRPNELSGGEQQRVAIARALVNDPLVLFADEPTGNLDSKTEEEIIKVLESLNRQGITIIMVTHEKEVAVRARRIITMRDGKILSDETVKHGPSNSPTAENAVSVGSLMKEIRSSGMGAHFFDHCRQALHAIFSHKLRSFLSMLGITIGVTAVIAMLALGEGAKESISQRLASLGSNLLSVSPGSRRLHGVAMEAGAVTRFTLQDSEALLKLPQVKRTSCSVRGRGQMVYKNKNWNTTVQGNESSYAAMRASVPKIGRFFTDEEVRSRAKVVVLGATVVNNLFENENPLGRDVKINRINFKVIGILPEKGSGGWRDQDDVVVIPITTAMYRLLGKEYVDSIDVEIKDSNLMEEAQKAMRDVIRKRAHLAKDAEDNFEIRNMAEIQETLESTTTTMTLLLGFIAAISLLVGGIGIMNIMLVSVTERTKEIGLRKAIGAGSGDLLIQFLIEAVMMTVLGGCIGIAFGWGIAKSLSLIAGWATKVSLQSVLVSTSFSILIGVVFGVWPARQASRMNPVEALRYE
ncbi:MAG: ABC transporter permease [Candidatus Aureabacteria bacterium]|nr:ABC transporter permease [Candidatus Auribacterota bacterium]